MSDLTLALSNPSVEKLVALGDAALEVGDLGLADGLYAQAAKRASGRQRVGIESRRELVARPTKRTPGLLAILKAVEALDGGTAFVGDGLATFGKNLPFLFDDRFRQINERHKALLPLANWQWNLATVIWAVNQVRNLPGDFVELGVFKGHTTLFTAEYVDFQAWDKAWHLFDTFDGIPEDQLDRGWEKANLDAYKGTFSFEEVEARFAHIPNIHVNKGKVPEVLERLTCPQIAFLHIDMNNARAEIAALDLLYDRITPGGVIVFDDYMWLPSHAQHDAEKAWFQARGLVVLPSPTGQGVFIKPPQ